MYLEIPQGNKVDIQGLQCCLPPVGYVFNIATRQLEFRGIYERSPIKEEQYWERIPLPDWYRAIVKKWDDYDKKKKEDDPDFYDEKLEEYKSQEWDRRLNGFWFSNNGTPTYITGGHYFFLQWIMIDIGYPKFRIPDLEYYYFQQYCIEDPNCMGMLEITKRRFGKTFRGGAFLLEYPTRTKMTQGGIQSKSGADAKKVFAKAVINPFIKLPKFFRPEYDMQGGIRPKTEIKFQQTNVRGKKAEEGLDKEELGSMIDHQSADPLAYDGQKLHRVFQDEWAKTIECDIYERHEVIRYCLLDDEGRIIGKALYSSTVEVLDTEKDGVQEAAIKLWRDSDQQTRNEDGRTASGLYRFFMTADRAKNFDIYGFPDVEKTIKQILADRETVKHNQKSWAARVRKEARTIQEAFYTGNDKCEFNAERMADRIQYLESNPAESYWRQCRLQEVVDEKTGHITVKPVDDPKGDWWIGEFPENANNYGKIGGLVEGKNKLLYQGGADTYRNIFADDGSEGVLCFTKKSQIIDGEEKGLKPVAFFVGRPKLIKQFNRQAFLGCLYYGCTINFEIDAGTWFYEDFTEWGGQRLLEWTPAIDPLKRGTTQIKPGTESASPFQLAKQLEVAKLFYDGDQLDGYNGNVHRVNYIPLLKDSLAYNHSERTPHHLTVAFMMSLLPMLGQTKPPVQETRRMTPIFPTYQVRKPA